MANILSDTLIVAKDLHKAYAQGSESVEVLRGIGLDVNVGDAIAILGHSGAGKSTLMHILGTLDRPDRGQLFYRGQNILDLDDEELARFRNEKMGFVFQFHHLVSELTALENVMLPALIAGQFKGEAEARAAELFQLLQIDHRRKHYPKELSGGELQRVSIARALMRNPEVLFADEPTGNLDSQNSMKVQDLFFQLREKFNLTLLVVTHDLQFATRFPQVLRMKDGLWS